MSDGLFQPQDTSTSLPMALLRAREAVMSRFRPMLHSHGITEQQWRVIRVMAESERIDVSNLAARASILGPSLSRILRTLESQAFIIKKRDADDGRVFWLTLAPRGHELIKSVQPDSEKIYAELETVLGKQTIDDLLSKLADITDRLSGR